MVSEAPAPKKRSMVGGPITSQRPPLIPMSGLLFIFVLPQIACTSLLLHVVYYSDFADLRIIKCLSCAFRICLLLLLRGLAHLLPTRMQCGLNFRYVFLGDSVILIFINIGELWNIFAFVFIYRG